MPLFLIQSKMMLKNLTWQSYLFFTILFAVCCTDPEPRKTVNVDHIELPPIRIERFDRALDSLAGDNALEKHVAWKAAYGPFYRDFIEHILHLGPVDDDAAVAATLGQIAQTADFQALADSVQKTFAGVLPAQEAGLEDAFRRVRYYFPEAELPQRFIGFFSGFALQTPIGEDYIGIGLDLFLGAESPFYPAIVAQFPLYISRRFTPEHIVPNVVWAFIDSEIVPSGDPGGTVLEQMLHHGKMMYLMDLLLPETADSLKIGYTEKQLAWAQHFEVQIWDWFVSENLLYQSGHSLSQKYFGEAPFTVGLGERNESAPKLGIFIGWQLVRSYMERHPETSVPALLELRDAQAFLKAARYRGR